MPITTMVDAITAAMKPNVALGPYCVYSAETRMGLRVRDTHPPAFKMPSQVPC